MSNLETLRKRLQIINRNAVEIPPETEKEKQIFEYLSQILQLQIECEEFRNSLRSAFRICSTIVITEKAGETEIEKLRTRFKWEALRDTIMNEIAKKENIGLDFYKNKIKQLRE